MNNNIIISVHVNVNVIFRKIAIVSEWPYWTGHMDLDSPSKQDDQEDWKAKQIHYRSWL